MFSVKSWAIVSPKNEFYVNDYASVLSGETKKLYNECKCGIAEENRSSDSCCNSKKLRW